MGTAHHRNKLTPKEERFVREYLLEPNATKAAARAGYSERSARQAGSNLLKKPLVALALQRQRAALQHETAITAERVLGELAKIAFASMRTFVKVSAKGVTARPWTEIGEADLAAIAEVQERVVNGKRVVSFKLHDKLAALQMLGKHLGLFVDKHEHELGQRLISMLDEIKGRMSPAARRELVDIVGAALDEADEASKADAAQEQTLTSPH